jgi:anti-anti-sigma regulatory factor
MSRGRPQLSRVASDRILWPEAHPILLRILQTVEGPTTVLSIEGRLVGAGVGELKRTCQDAAPLIAIDLTHLHWADAQGISTLNAMADAGLELRGVSPYIALLLNRPTA